MRVDAYPNEEFKGRIYAVEPVGRREDPHRRRARPDSEQAGQAQPGMFGRVACCWTARPNAVIVPEQAIWPQGRDSFVYRVVDGKAVLTKVDIGNRAPGRVEIAQGPGGERHGRHRRTDEAQGWRSGQGAPARRRRRAGGASRRRACRQLSREPNHSRRRDRMVLSEISIKRPVLATVMSLVIVLIGFLSYLAHGRARVSEHRPARGLGAHGLQGRHRAGDRKRHHAAAGRFALRHRGHQDHQVPEPGGSQPDHDYLRDQRAKSTAQPTTCATASRASARSCRRRPTTRSCPRSRRTPSPSSGSRCRSDRHTPMEMYGLRRPLPDRPAQGACPAWRR